MSDTPSKEVVELTYFWDRLRGCSLGVVETIWTTFALIVAIRYFHADESIKRYLPAAAGLGLLLSPLFLALASRFRQRVSTQLAWNWFFIGLCLLCAAFVPGAALFIAFIGFAQVIHSQSHALQTHLYSRNYTSRERGKRVSMTHVAGSFAAIGFGYLGGFLLDRDIDNYRVLLLLGSAFAFAAAAFSMRIPSASCQTLHSVGILRGLAVVWRDKLFLWMLVAWMIMGLGNLMMIPLRVEYLANPAYGINLSNTEISAILVSTVMVFRLLSTRIWGALFDATNLVTTRVLLNFTFLFSIAIFFNSTSILFLALGASLFGVALGGGALVWALYVTKIAPPEQLTTYMGMHGFFTGWRALAAPFIGYAILAHAHPSVAVFLSVSMIGTSTLIFLPMRRAIEARRNSLGP